MSKCQNCGCDTIKCGCVAEQANIIRSGVEHQITRMLGKCNLGVTERDGLRENNIGLLRELRMLHEHFLASQGAMCVHVEAERDVPCEFEVDHDRMHERYLESLCETDFGIEPCVECYPEEEPDCGC